MIYRVGKSEANSVKQVEELLGAVQSGTNLDFTVGVIRAGKQNQGLATLSMTAR